MFKVENEWISGEICAFNSCVDSFEKQLGTGKWYKFKSCATLRVQVNH